MRFAVWWAGLAVVIGGAGCSSSTQPSEPPLEGMTGAWVGLAPEFTPADSLELVITDSAGTAQVSGHFHSGTHQEYTGGIAPSSSAGLTLRLNSISPPFVADLSVRLEGASLVGTYNDAPFTLVRMHSPPVETGLWIRTSITATPGPTYPSTDSIWILPDARVRRKLEVRYDVDFDCSTDDRGFPLNRPHSLVMVFLYFSYNTSCNFSTRDSLIIQGSTLRRRTDTISGVIEEVYQHRAH